MPCESETVRLEEIAGEAVVPGQAINTKGATMSNHYSAADLKFPGDDARLDFTDLFLFRRPATRARQC
jgi:hypothetical protein